MKLLNQKFSSESGQADYSSVTGQSTKPMHTLGAFRLPVVKLIRKLRRIRDLTKISMGKIDTGTKK